jgi:elongation factor Ts
MAITAAQVKELRDATGAGMMDAKKALTETDGDMEAAVDWLRTKGLAKAAKKADRVAAEGLVGVHVEGGRGVAVEVNSETDFVAKNADFQNLVRGITKAALGVGDVAALKAADMGGKTVETALTEAISTIGENMTLRRMARIEGDAVAAYVHNAAADGLGRIGVLVALKGADAGIGKQLAMHVAATAPMALSEAEMDPAVLEREREVQTQKALEENATAAKPKPDAGDPQQHHPRPDEEVPRGSDASGPEVRHQPRRHRRAGGEGRGRRDPGLRAHGRGRGDREARRGFRRRGRQDAGRLISGRSHPARTGRARHRKGRALSRSGAPWTLQTGRSRHPFPDVPNACPPGADRWPAGADRQTGANPSCKSPTSYASPTHVIRLSYVCHTLGVRMSYAL